jgi:hypothetical protein
MFVQVFEKGKRGYWVPAGDTPVVASGPSD